MLNRVNPALSPCAAALAALALAASPAAAGDTLPFVPGEIVVALTPGANAAALAALYGGVVLDSITSRNIHRLGVPPGTPEETFINDVQNDPRVVSVELNFIGDDRNPDGTTQSIFILSEAPAYLAQPAISRVRADEASTRARGRGSLVAVIDSGIDPGHPVFAGRISPAGIDLIDRDLTPLDVGDNIDTNLNGVADEGVGHGTLVAGIVLRVAPEATILPIRVLDSDGGSTTFRMIDGLYRAADLGADIINLSLGTLAPSQLLQDAIDEVTSLGSLVVAAAGNDATDQFQRFPAGLSGPGLLSVAATRDNDRVATFSNFGSTISLTAPGDPVVGPIPGGLYGSARGTSFAAPIVAGVAALLREAMPCGAAADIAARVLATADPIDNLNPAFAGSIGAGRVNAAAALGLEGAPLRATADLAPAFGTLDINDVLAFAAGFNTADPSADMSPPTGDGSFDINDVLVFAALFNGACP